jgi:hypothetical protein
MLSKSYQATQDSAEKINFHGAAILDQYGREVPITPDMVDCALQQASDFLCPKQPVWNSDSCQSS